MDKPHPNRKNAGTKENEKRNKYFAKKYLHSELITYKASNTMQQKSCYFKSCVHC